MPKSTAKNPDRPLIYHRRMAARMTQDEYARTIGVHRVTLAKAEQYGWVPGKVVARKIAALTGQESGEVMSDYMRRAS